MHGEENLYIYRSAKKNFSFYFYIDGVYTTENVFLFCSSVASEWHSLWKYKYHASFCSFGSLITEKGKCYTYIYIYTYGKVFSHLSLLDIFIPIFEKNNIFLHEYSLSLSTKGKKKERKKNDSNDFLYHFNIHVSLNDRLLFLSFSRRLM